LKNAKIGFALLLIWTLVVMILWGFAFLPTPESSPEWLLRTQAVCFGTNETGLPGSQGWILLVLGPLALFSFMWATHASELGAARALVRSSRPVLAFSAVFFLSFVVEAHLVGRRITAGVRMARVNFTSPQNGALPPDYPRTSNPAPEFSLQDQRGKHFTTKDLTGRVTLLTFAYAHCATVCPLLVHDTLEARKRLGRDSVNAVFITLDPWRDTVASLPARAEKWAMDEGDFLLSGPVDDVQKTLAGFGAVSRRDMKTGEIAHPALILVIDQNGKIAYSFLNPSIEWLTEAASRLLREQR